MRHGRVIIAALRQKFGGAVMDPLRQAAYISISRACGFAGLAIFCVMAGLSFEPVLATKVGGVLALVVVGVLLLKCFYLRYQDHRKTELWLILDKRYRPPEAYAKRLSRQVLRETYLGFAKAASGISVMLLSLSMLLAASGFEGIGSKAWGRHAGDSGDRPALYLLGSTPDQGDIP